MSLPAGFTLAPPAMGGAKRTLRHAAAEVRARATDAAVTAAGQIADHFIAWRRPLSGDAVAVYWPIRSELDTRHLIRQLHAIGCRVGLPAVAGRASPLTFRLWTPDTVMKPGAMGIDVPPTMAEEVVPRTIVAPLLAFDRRG
ncbi:MAG: 5-formyltetrahydrofolate cyclo-ligase, partial [Pseudomonadota bacterium]|nr:5-formyltetrahydrofolate cyclo-ligase [Pseudomonadota bacterium]